ncbi:hypothetical protein ANRL3_02851 [Anaerolineae bacterium]|nr:hypothetical protein ANRL3_02851 [Anaerolineae bacterium]
MQLTMRFLFIIFAVLTTACTASPTATRQRLPSTTPTSQVHMTLKTSIVDKVTKKPVKALVKWDNEIVFRDVSYFELSLPGDILGEPIYVWIEAPGYMTWGQGYRHHLYTSKYLEFTVELDRMKLD